MSLCQGCPLPSLRSGMCTSESDTVCTSMWNHALLSSPEDTVLYTRQHLLKISHEWLHYWLFFESEFQRKLSILFSVLTKLGVFCVAMVLHRDSACNPPSLPQKKTHLPLLWGCVHFHKHLLTHDKSHVPLWLCLAGGLCELCEASTSLQSYTPLCLWHWCLPSHLCLRGGRAEDGGEGLLRLSACT